MTIKEFEIQLALGLIKKPLLMLKMPDGTLEVTVIKSSLSDEDIKTFRTRPFTNDEYFENTETFTVTDIDEIKKRL